MQDQYNKIIRKIIIEAGEILLNRKKDLATIKPTYKESEGLVSEVDHQSEQFIKAEVLKNFPDHFFLGEEDTFANKENVQKARDAKHCWFVDPLDGTNNYLNNLDYYCVSIAHSFEGNLDFGMIYAPERKELYYAATGEGAYFENLETGEITKLDVTKEGAKPFNRSFCVTSLNSLGGKYEEKFKAFKLFNESCLSIRRFGSAALELCHTARGMFSTCWDYGLKPWDVNAGIVICLEAGMSVKSFENKKVKVIDSSIYVTKKEYVDDVFQIIDECFNS